MNEPTSPPLEFVSYAEFGEQFFTHVVTDERVREAVDIVTGQPLELGPVGVGPGRLVRLSARGGFGRARTEPAGGHEIGHHVTVPVELAFAVDLGLEVIRFVATLEVPLLVTARAVHGLRVYLDVTPPTADDVVLDLQAQGIRASVLQRVAGLEGEVRRFVASYVAKELRKPAVQEARLIDVADAIDTAWTRATEQHRDGTTSPVGSSRVPRSGPA